MANDGLRVLALAFKYYDQDDLSDDEKKAEAIETELCFIGLIGIIDPPRTEVGPAIEVCKNAGIRVIMITGDHPDTARSIATTLGILTPEDVDFINNHQGEEGSELVMIGAKLDLIDKKSLSEREIFPKVFARVSPQNKLKIVKALQMRKEIVAMTGDGVNDAPAIKHANIGVAMGMTGTDLAKQAADMILVDDSFTTIISAVEEGRRTMDNIKKFVFYLLSANSSEIFLMLFLIAIGLDAPFTAVMILYANIIADVPPSLALGVDPAEKDVLTRLPRDPNAGFFNFWSASLVVVQGINMAMISAVVYVVAVWGEGYTVPVARTLVYATLTVMQMVHAFVSKSIKHSTFSRDSLNNKSLIIGVIISILLLIFGIYTPIVNGILELVPFPIWDWGKVILASIIHVIIMEFIKLLLRIQEYTDPKEHKFYSDV
eukprot:TRINITY_DN2030_c0_g2_i1.p1 TRINITY_DN2030_c0_g2~~TRINITY_DN2030_c0_g2_i1.p1  ORF type:complete len:431 (+),score=195.57 TRINITY_DN2030_c0_g2_i1:47-1339(+)